MYKLRVTGVSASVKCTQIGQGDGLAPCVVCYFYCSGFCNELCVFYL